MLWMERRNAQPLGRLTGRLQRERVRSSRQALSALNEVAMTKLTKQEQLAIEAVAKHFSATWEKGEDPPDAYVTIAKRRIAVEITTIMQRIVDRDGITKPRLRYDRVALRFVRDMQS